MRPPTALWLWHGGVALICFIVLSQQWVYVSVTSLHNLPLPFQFLCQHHVIMLGDNVWETCIRFLCSSDQPGPGVEHIRWSTVIIITIPPMPYYQVTVDTYPANLALWYCLISSSSDRSNLDRLSSNKTSSSDHGLLVVSGASSNNWSSSIEGTSNPRSLRISLSLSTNPSQYLASCSIHQQIAAIT